jgi:hypothetical protein
MEGLEPRVTVEAIMEEVEEVEDVLLCIILH